MPAPDATTLELRRIATQVLARRRFAVTGRFGLRVAPGGFATPAFGPADALEVVRVAGTALVHEVGADATVTPLVGSTLAGLAEAVGVDLGEPFAVGHDTPPLGDVDALLAIDAAAAAELAAWFDLGVKALDAVAATAARPSTSQLWPEHFDVAAAVAVGPGPDDRCNLGASAGDGFSPEPYLYVGPWGSDRPGDPAYWNAPFGAVLPRSAVPSLDAAVAFLAHGVERLTSA